MEAEGTVAKALAVLDLVAAQGGPVRFTDLLAHSPYPKATLHRLIQTLLAQGMLAYDATRQTYAPGLRLVQLAHSAWATSSLAPIARTHLERLAAETGETVHLAQLDGGMVLYVDKLNAAKPVEMFSQAGRVGPAHCTGVGKAMLAHLPAPALDAALDRQSWHRFTPTTITGPDAMRAALAQIRACGFALDNQEHEAGIICCAAPVLSAAGGVIGALSVTASTARRDLADLAAMAPQIRATAAAIAADAALWRFPGA